MINRLIALVAYLILVGFLGILIFKVPRLDLTILVGITLALAGWDMLRPVKK
jgi:small neutral amino acid transporter SnatA (MarC family)